MVQMTCIKPGLQVNMKAQSLYSDPSLTGLTEMLQNNHNFCRFLFLAVTSPSTQASKLGELIVNFFWGVWDPTPHYRFWEVVVPSAEPILQPGCCSLPTLWGESMAAPMAEALQRFHAFDKQSSWSPERIGMGRQCQLRDGCSAWSCHPAHLHSPTLKPEHVLPAAQQHPLATAAVEGNCPALRHSCLSC